MSFTKKQSKLINLTKSIEEIHREMRAITKSTSRLISNYFGDKKKILDELNKKIKEYRREIRKYIVKISFITPIDEIYRLHNEIKHRENEISKQVDEITTLKNILHKQSLNLKRLDDFSSKVSSEESILNEFKYIKEKYHSLLCIKNNLDKTLMRLYKNESLLERGIKEKVDLFRKNNELVQEINKLLYECNISIESNSNILNISNPKECENSSFLKTKFYIQNDNQNEKIDILNNNIDDISINDLTSLETKLDRIIILKKKENKEKSEKIKKEETLKKGEVLILKSEYEKVKRLYEINFFIPNSISKYSRNSEFNQLSPIGNSTKVKSTFNKKAISSYDYKNNTDNSISKAIRANSQVKNGSNKVILLPLKENNDLKIEVISSNKQSKKIQIQIPKSQINKKNIQLEKLNTISNDSKINHNNYMSIGSTESLYDESEFEGTLDKNDQVGVGKRKLVTENLRRNSEFIFSKKSKL